MGCSVKEGVEGAVNAVNPFDGNNGSPLGPLDPAGWMGNSGPMGLPSVPQLLGNGGLFASPAQTSGGGDQTAAAYQAQVQAAMMQADAAKYAADQQLKLGQAGIDAQLQMANQSMVGGVVAAALNSQKSNIVRKEMLPHEEGAAQIASLDLGMKWDKTLQMRIAGYSDVAINHELQGKSWKPLFRDAEWNTMNMMKQTKNDIMQNAQLFGFNTGSNPAGINMSLDEYLGMMSMKDPNELLKVDPQMAAQRNAQYDAWKQQMYASGNDLIVQMFENPQLSGGSIMSMKGKEALIDPRLAPLLQNMNQVKEPYDDLQTQLDQYDAMSKPKIKTLSDGRQIYVDGKGQPFQGSGSGRALKPGQTESTGKDKVNLGGSYAYNEAMEQYSAGRQKIIDEYNRKQHDYQQSLENKFKWDDAINSLTKGEKTKYTDQINKLIDAGVIERETGRVNGAALSKMIPPELMRSPEFSMYRQLSDQEKSQYTDEYNRLAQIKVDPKLVRTEAMGGGVTRKVLLNPDGTRAATMLEGYMMDATGQQRFVSMSGSRTQDFYDRASQIAGYSPLSPGYRAPISDDKKSGVLEKRSSDNYLAQYNTGQKGKSASQATSQATMTTKVPSAPKISMPTNPAASAGGAPLAAGDD